MISYYGQLRDGVEAFTNQWEALMPYEFEGNSQSATIEFMIQNIDKIEEFADVIINAFELAGIEVIEAWIFSEDDLEDIEYLDLDSQDEQEFVTEGSDLYRAVVHVRFGADGITRTVA